METIRDLELEEQDRRGYMAPPQLENEFSVWEDAAAWPEDWPEIHEPIGERY
jgi:hypothetical protein